jgi:hypothetical protein
MNDELHPEGNPQGKGAVPVLDALNALRPYQPSEKSAEQILKEFCLSTLVLSARFDFRVVPGKTYYLYRVNCDWRLSLIAPCEWGGRCPGPHVAQCELKPDMTWNLVLAQSVAEDAELLAALEQHLEGFINRISEAGKLEEALPIYESQLPYQQRLMATALSSSLQTSLLISGLAGTSGKALLSHGGVSQLLLASEGDLHERSSIGPN